MTRTATLSTLLLLPLAFLLLLPLPVPAPRGTICTSEGCLFWVAYAQIGCPTGAVCDWNGVCSRHDCNFTLCKNYGNHPAAATTLLP
uniref:Uncharacterized protein n=1 Tax=Aegilops tauschii TaxID=37682 RepID=N1R0A1_AEGTA